MDENDCPRTELEIQSPYIKKALKTCVPFYANIDVEGKSICLQDQPRCVFHYREQLINYHNGCLESGETDAALHVKFILDYMFNTLSPEIRHFTNFAENIMHPAIDFLSLWMVFVPGDIVYIEKKCHHTKARGSLMRLQSMDRCPCPRQWCGKYSWTLVAHAIDYDGHDFGHTERRVKVEPYEGVKAIQDLAVVPLRYHPDGDKIRTGLIERGEKFVQLHGRHYKQCKAVAELLSNRRVNNISGEEDLFPLRSTHVSIISCLKHQWIWIDILQVNERIMIDCAAFSDARPSHRPFLISTAKRFLVERGQHLEMSDEELMICVDSVAGYTLNTKQWGWFKVDTIQDIDFNEDAFDSLILQDNVKQMILALVKPHTNESLAFDDVIKGKGKGTIFLLHGEPGTGKTLTAGE